MYRITLKVVGSYCPVKVS